MSGGPPGGAAPKALVGTWQTTLTAAELRKTSAQDAHRTWQLVIVNSRFLSYPRALGFRPAGVGGDTVPFAVAGHRLLLSCLNDSGAPTKGYGTYTWSVTGKTLRFRLVSEACRGRSCATAS